MQYHITFQNQERWKHFLMINVDLKSVIEAKRAHSEQDMQENYQIYQK